MDMVTGFGFLVKGAHQMPDMLGGCGLGLKLLMAAFGVFWIIMLVNCLQRKFKVDTDKIAWVLVLIFLPVIGAFIYLFSLYYKPSKKK